MSVSAARKPGRVFARTVLFGASALVAAGLLTWTPSAVTGWNQGAAEGTLWQLINGARVNNGMAPLQQHATLVGLARWRSQDMLNQDYFSHTIPGCGCQVYAYYDQNGLNYVWGGENIGWNSGLADGDSPVAVHNQFMNSSGHRANVLNASWTHGGVGAAAADNYAYQGYVQNTRMYTQLFMQAAGAAPAPAPAAPAPAGPAPAPGAPASRPAPAAGAAAPVAPAEPTAFEVAVDAPVRPSSSAIDGSAERIRPARSFASLVVAAARALAAEAIASAPSPQTDRGVEVAAAETQDAGLFGDVFGTFFGLISG
ncbi:MAG: CAP domain-containing protein [Chloroflexota bacterium]